MADFTNLLSGMSNRDIGYVIKNIIQKSINSELTNAEIADVDDKTPVLISNTKDVELINDISIQTVIPIDNSVEYKLSEDVDGDTLRLWLKFENAGKLIDYSLSKNTAYSIGASNLPGIFHRPNDNHILKTDIFSYFNGVNQYAYVLDNERIRITPLLTANTPVTFFVRMLPISLSQILGSSANSWFTKVDDDQLRYGYGVNINSKGDLYFYVRKDYNQYYIYIKDAYSDMLTNPLYNSRGVFEASNFRDRNFITKYSFLCDLIDSSLKFDDWHFEFNPTTSRIIVYKSNLEDGTVVMGDTDLISQKPIMSYSIQEGKHKHDGTIQTTVYDNSGNNRHGTIQNITVGGDWEEDNTFRFNGGNELGVGKPSSRIELPSVTAMQSLTEFTYAFWYNPLDSIFNEYDEIDQRIVMNGSASTHVYSIRRLRNSNDVRFRIEDSVGNNHDAVFPNAFPTVNQWYFVVCKWKSGEKLKISINNTGEVQSDATYSATIASTRIPRIGSYSEAPKMKIALFKFYNIQISQATQDSLYAEGYHSPLFPKSESIQPVPDPTPDTIIIPYSTVYELDRPEDQLPTEDDYRKINTTAGNNTYSLVFDVPDGADESVPETKIYDVVGGTPSGSNQDAIYSVPDGVSSDSGVGSNMWSMDGDEGMYEVLGNGVTSTATVSIPSSDNSAAILGADSGEKEIAGCRIISTSSGMGQTLNGKIIREATFWLRSVSSPSGTVYCRIWDDDDNLVRTIGSKLANTIGTSWGAYTFIENDNTVVMGLGYTIGIEFHADDSNDQIHVQRRGENSDSSVTSTSYDGDSWNDNTSYDMKCTLTYVVVGTNLEYSKAGEKIQLTSGGNPDQGGMVLNNQEIKSFTMYLKRVNSATGTIYGRVWNSSGNVIVQLGSKDVTTISSSEFQAVTFVNSANTVKLASGSRIGVEYVTGNDAHQIHYQIKDSDGDPTMRLVRYNSIDEWNDHSNKEAKIDITYGVLLPAVDPNIIMKSGDITKVAEYFGSGDIVLTAGIPTKLTFRLKKVGSPTGTLTAAITSDTGSTIVSFGTKDVATTLTTSVTDVEFTNLTNTTDIDITNMVTLSWSPSASGEVHVLSNKGNNLGGNNHNGTSSYLRTFKGSSWTNTTSADVSGKVSITAGSYTGYINLDNTRWRTGVKADAVTSSLIGDKITKVITTMKTTATAPPVDNIYCNIRDPSNIVKAQLGFVNVASVGTSDTTVVFSNVYNEYQLEENDTISIEYGSGTSTRYLMVRTNLDVFEGLSTVLFESMATNVGIADVVLNRDLAAEIYTGGKNFASFIKFLPNVIRVTEKIVNDSSSVANKKITSITGRFQRIGTPSGNVSCNIRDVNDNIKVAFPQIAVSTIGTSGYSNLSFINNNHEYVFVDGDKVSFEYADGTAFNHIQISVNQDVIDGQNSIAQIYDGLNYTDLGHADLAIKMYTGGELDSNSRERIAQYISHNSSRLKGAILTRIKSHLYRTTTDTTGTVYCNIRRGTDDNLMKTLGTITASALPTDPTTPLECIFNDTTNTYPLAVTDKICIEFSGGSGVDSVGVLVRSVTPNYDDVFSHIRKYDGVDYEDTEFEFDLCAVMESGGNEFTPEADAIPDPTPVNDKDLILMGGNNKKSGFFDGLLSEFRIYAKLLSSSQITNLHRNRFVITDIESDEILMPLTFKPSSS